MKTIPELGSQTITRDTIGITCYFEYPAKPSTNCYLVETKNGEYCLFSNGAMETFAERDNAIRAFQEYIYTHK